MTRSELAEVSLRVLHEIRPDIGQLAARPVLRVGSRSHREDKGGGGDEGTWKIQNKVGLQLNRRKPASLRIRITNYKLKE